MRSLFIALMLFAVACSHGGDSPYSTQFCADVAPAIVTPCPGYPTASIDNIHYTLATCTDANYTDQCQIDTQKTYAYVVCVDSCDAAAADFGKVQVTAFTSGLEAVGVHLCDPVRGDNAFGAICDSLDVSMHYGYSAPQQGGFWQPVACLEDCEVYPVVQWKRAQSSSRF